MLSKQQQYSRNEVVRGYNSEYLPDIGLGKYKNLDLDRDISPLNPFRIEKNSQKLFAIREREREVQNLKRLKELLKAAKNKQFMDISSGKVSYQTTSSRYLESKRDRAGVVRLINNIMSRDIEKQIPQRVIIEEEKDENENLKLNIFKNPEDLKKISQAYLSQRSITPISVNQRFQSQESSSLDKYRHKTPQQLEIRSKDKLLYLKSGGEGKENIRDYIQQSRSLLYTQLSVKNKQTEMSKLNQFIKEEELKLETARTAYEEDCKKFDLYVEEVDKKKQDNAEQKSNLQKQNEHLSKEILRIEEEISKVDNEYAELEQKLQISHKTKEFVSTLGEEVRISKANTRKKKVDKRSQKINFKRSETLFLTEADTAKKPPRKYFTIKQQSSIEEELEEDDGVSYFDDDEPIQYTRKDVLKYFQGQEEANLFLIRLIGNDEIELEEIRSTSEAKQQKLKNQISEMSANMEQLEVKLQDATMKLSSSNKRERNLGDGVNKVMGMKLIQIILRRILRKLNSVKDSQNVMLYEINELSMLELLKCIEQKLRLLLESYTQIMQASESSSQMQRELQEKMRLLMIERKNKKMLEAQNREKVERQKRLERHMERIQKAEKINYSVGRVAKPRSMKPMVKRVEIQVETDEEEEELKRYIGDIIQ